MIQTKIYGANMIQTILGDSAIELNNISDESIDLTVTSPPYDDLRTYNGFTFDFETIAKHLYRVTKPGGVVVWVVNDSSIDGSETGTSFKQALFFKEIGFNLHDTMIWMKAGFTDVASLKWRYGQIFEYMFVFAKGRIKTFNPIKDRPNKNRGQTLQGTIRQRDGSIKLGSTRGRTVLQEFGQRYNIWEINAQKTNEERVGHPAQFPIQLAKDHIISWSNEGDTVLDPFMGSGTTGIACKYTNRNFIGIEISEKYYNMANDRINNTVVKSDLFNE